MKQFLESKSPFSFFLFVTLLLQLGVISISIAAASLALGAMLLLVAAWTIADREWVVRSTPLDYFFLAYCAVEFITAATSAHPADALHNAKRLILISIVYASVLAFDSRPKIRIGIMGLGLVVALLSVFEIGMYFAEHKDRLNIFQSYMTAGGLKMMLALVLLPFLLDKKTPASDKRYIAAFLVPVIIALLLTNTRSSWLGFVAGGIVIAVVQYKKFIFILAAAVVAFFLFAPAHQVDRARSIVDMNHPSNYGRIHMWQTGLKIAADHPFLGVGDTDLHSFYEQYKEPTDTETGGHLHNNMVTLLVTIGGIGLAVVLALFVRIFIVLLNAVKRHRTDWLYGSVSIGVLAAYCAFHVNGVFEWNFGDHEIMVFLWFFIGLVLAVDRTAAGEAAA